ncbi:Copia protein, partial [Mucuna pruriens]
MNTPMNKKEKFSKEDGADKVNEVHFRSLIGCLMYLTSIRPDILFPVSMLSRFMHCASELHLKAAKRVVRYIKGTVNYGVKYYQVRDFELLDFCDSDWASSFDDMKSTLGYCFSMDSGVFSWCSKKQEVVTQSTTEVEFIAAVATVNQVIWLRNILTYLGLKQDKIIEVFVDNQAAISISQNPIFHGKTKHFNVKLFHLREVQENGNANLIYCRTEDQAADMFTKPFPLNRFEFAASTTLNRFEFPRKKLGVCSLHDKEEC